MYLYSVVFSFITVLSSARSYVLLAANIEDFRTLAKQFVPDNMADEILEMAKDAIGRDTTNKPYPYLEYRGEEQADEEAQESNDSEVSVRSVHKYIKGSKSKPSKQSTDKYELSLDDLVEKVKERLQSEISQMAANAAKAKILLQAKEKKIIKPPNKPVPPNDSFYLPSANQPPPTKNLPSKYKESIGENIDKKPRQEQRKKKLKRQINDQKYVAEMFVAEPPKYLYNLGKPVELQQSIHPQSVTIKIQQKDAPRPGRNKTTPKQHQVNNNNQNINRQRKIVQPKQITTTTQTVETFVGVDMAVTNDSYEDYVLPKKDNDHFESEKRPKTVKKVLENFSNEYETTTKDKELDKYEGETTNYNKKRKNKEAIKKKDDSKYFKQRPGNRDPESPAVVPLAAENTEQQIQPYAEQLQDTVYADETEETVTEEQKARSAIISLNDYTNSQYLAPHGEKQVTDSRIKKNKKPKQATDIPKRDMYKVSSPNYLVKIPIVGEKYRFDEPIPEEDRMRENFEPAAQPGLINGKVLI